MTETITTETTTVTTVEQTAAWFDATFSTAPLMAIFRGTGVERSVRLATTAWDLGIDLVEVTLQSDADVESLRELVRLGEERGKIVGAGTIVSPEQVPGAIAAGAHYLVSPGLDPLVVREAQRLGIPVLPGVSTPTEVQLAVSMGLRWLKAFPAQWLGADWFKHIRGPFPQVRFVATGGLDASNAQQFLDAGVRVVAVGSALEDPDQLNQLAQLLGASASAGATRQ
jgi:2-dehydro-3-deoxyphosphogluconate aldolase/(4S)-4-hydroxy-2-oxoglutarate aldolase